MHYDLAWNPTRHEQREGRVDRFGQTAPTVRTITYYGADNKIDGVVLDVLIRRHEAIKRSTGVSVPVPVDSATVMNAIWESLLLRGTDPDQLTLDFGPLTTSETADAVLSSMGRRGRTGKSVPITIPAGSPATRRSRSHPQRRPPLPGRPRGRRTIHAGRAKPALRPAQQYH